MDSEVRQKFQIVKQAELSYEVLLDGEHIEEFSDESSASEYVCWFSAKLDDAYSAGMRAGEIAMKEKAVKAVADELPCDCGFEENPVRYKYSSESGHAMNCNQYAALGAIRALPAAPEEKKP